MKSAILAFFRALHGRLQGASEKQQGEPPLPIWVVAANIVYEREFGEERERRPGTKHFAGGSKVYVVETGWPDRVQVVGMARASHHWIRVWTRRSYLANARVKMVYSPQIAAHINRNTRNIWDGSEKSREKAELLAVYIQRRGAGRQHFRHQSRPQSP